MKSPLLIVLLGPTAIGKTALSLQIASQLQCPILSADSRQMYQQLKIGTAAPTTEELAVAQHYFIGQLRLTDYYSAAQYENDVIRLLEQLHKEHPVVLLTGGSMMYIDAVCKGIDDIPTIDADTRALMKERYVAEGLDALCAELKWRDPEYYDIVDKKNHKRIIHALEICYMTGRPYSYFRKSIRKQRPFDILKIGLQRDRAELFNRINRRVDLMMEEGLLDEVKSVYKYKDLNSLNTVGYKELFCYLDGIYDLPLAIEKIKKNTRVYAKKQMTWFKKDEEIHWFHPDETEKIFKLINSKVTI